MNKLLSDVGNPGQDGYSSSSPFGTISLPDSISAKYGDNPGTALGGIIQIAVWVLIIGACVYSLFNFILAGYAFLSAGDDPKKISGAWAKIWQTALGLTVAAGAFILARIIGQLVFGNPTFITNPTIPTL